MTIYRRMYAILCSAASAALDSLPEIPENAVGRELLLSALLEAEEVYISEPDEETEE